MDLQLWESTSSSTSWCKACRWPRRRRTAVIRRRTRSRPLKRWGSNHDLALQQNCFFFIFLLFNFKWFRSVRSHRLHASSLGMPFRLCNALDQKIWSISRYATQWSECSSKCSDMMGLQSRSDHQSLNILVAKNCLKSNLNYMTVSSTISIEGLRFSQDCVLWNHWWQRDCYKY